MVRSRLAQRLRLASVFLFAATGCVPGSTSPGRVCTLDRVLDGDSMRVVCAGKPTEVRLYCIDAPEHGQRPWDRQSRRHLRESATRDLELVDVDRDRYGRIVAEVWTRGGERRSLNLEQVAQGQAAVYRRYCDDPRFERAERQARRAGLGIWAKPGAQQTPWVYRHRAAK